MVRVNAFRTNVQRFRGEGTNYDHRTWQQCLLLSIDRSFSLNIASDEWWQNDCRPSCCLINGRGAQRNRRLGEFAKLFKSNTYRSKVYAHRRELPRSGAWSFSSFASIVWETKRSSCLPLSTFLRGSNHVQKLRSQIYEFFFLAGE